MWMTIEVHGQTVRPQGFITVRRVAGDTTLLWAGFARQDAIAWWLKRGAEEVDISATRFALRSEFDRQRQWIGVGPGEVLKGILVSTGLEAVVRILTRNPSPGEVARYQASRIPVVGAPAYSNGPRPSSGENLLFPFP